MSSIEISSLHSFLSGYILGIGHSLNYLDFSIFNNFQMHLLERYNLKFEKYGLISFDIIIKEQENINGEEAFYFFFDLLVGFLLEK